MRRPISAAATPAAEAAGGQAPGLAARLTNLRTFQSLKVRQYRYFFGSSLAQMACMNMQMVVNGWFVYKLTGQASLLGLTMLANAIPTLALSFFGGIIADRVSKKAVLVVAMAASALLALWIALSTSFGIITWHYLLVSSLIQGTIMSLAMPSRQSIIPELVGRENLMNAVALNNAGMNVNQIGAPALAGFMVAGAGIAGVYYLMAGLYVVAGLLALPLRPTPGGARPQHANRGVFLSIKDGLTYVRQNQILAAVLLLSLFTVVLSMPFRMLLPVFTEDVLKVGPDKLGVLISVSGVGALVGSLVIASLGSKGRGMLFLHTGLLSGLAVIAFALSGSYWLSLGIMVVAGLAQSGRMTLSSTLIQSYTEDAYLGRVMSLFMMQWGLVSLGTFGISVVAEFVGVRGAVGATSGLLVLLTLYYYAFSPRIRRLD